MARPTFMLSLLFVSSLCRATTNVTATIQWQPCDPSHYNATVALDCATLQAPLDYTSNSSGQLTLDLIRTPATILPSKGSIIFNFGGPGEGGRDGFVATVPLLVPIIGGEYDLVSFDPRGTGNTLPVSCFVNDWESFNMMFDISQFSSSSDTSAARLWARAGVDAELCSQRAGENGSLVSTAFTARDTMKIAEALSEDGMLRYYGYSYGTLLGFTIAAMFPDRIDKMLLDGVENPQEAINSVARIEEWTDSDKVFSAIFSTCIQAGDNCTLSRRGMNAAQLEHAAWNLLDSLKQNPIPLGDFVLDYSALKGVYQYAVYGAPIWPFFVTILDLLFDFDAANSATLATLIELVNPTATTAQATIDLTMALAAISCVDKKPRVATFQDFKPTLEKLYQTSSLMGDAEALVAMRCAQWQIEPKERYDGGFEVHTKNPVLFIGNAWDGDTPLRSAYNVSAGFPGSVVLEVRGYGHSTLAVPSTCALEKIRAYWNNGTLPHPGTICQADGAPYSNVTWATVFAELD